MLRRTRIAMTACLLFALCASAAYASPPSPAHPAGRELGVVPAHSQASRFSPAGSNLSYHGGPVMHSNNVYEIFWIPPGYTVSANYRSVIDAYFKNVAADSGKSSNVYFSDTQYSDGTGSSAYNSTWQSSVTDTSQFPASGCRDSYTSTCLTDAQLQSEITRIRSANGWPTGLNNIYFLFTPRNVGSCDGSTCAYSYYCAYHGWIGSGSTATLYANMPYAAYVPAACGSGQSPNNDDADSTLNVTSHEHNEAITDPLGNAWYDRRGYENGDKCAWNFGSTIGSNSFGSYNQLINAGTYYLQQEWSNRSSRCVLTGT